MLEHEDIVLTNVARGDNASFGVLFNHYYPKIRVYLTNVLEDKHSAQDIAQDIFAKIWLLRKTLPEIRDFGSYLFVMSRNSCLAHMKKRGRSTSIHDLELVEEHAIDEMLHSDELRSRIFRIVDDMPSRRRQVFLMSREENKSNMEIAEILCIKKKTVENLLNAALRQLRRSLNAILFF